MTRDPSEAATYAAPPIMAHAIERQTSRLRPVVARYLDGGELSPTELLALHQYLTRWILWKAQTLAQLAEEVTRLKEREDFVRWFAEARFHDFDPVE